MAITLPHAYLINQPPLMLIMLPIPTNYILSTLATLKKRALSNWQLLFLTLSALKKYCRLIRGCGCSCGFRIGKTKRQTNLFRYESNFNLILAAWRYNTKLKNNVAFVKHVGFFIDFVCAMLRYGRIYKSYFFFWKSLLTYLKVSLRFFFSDPLRYFFFY